MKRRTPLGSLQKGWKMLSRPEMHMCKKQQELQLSTNFAIVVSTRGRELFRLLTIVAWSLIQVESTLFTLMRNSVLGQEIYLLRIISILNFNLITLCRFSF